MSQGRRFAATHSDRMRLRLRPVSCGRSRRWSVRINPRGAFLFSLGSNIVVPFMMLVCMGTSSRLYSSDARFASGQSALAIPFRLDDNCIYLRVGVNGSRPLSFMLDSGASKTILSLRNARSFDMQLQPL